MINKKQKKAFTMIEGIFAIIVIGILATIAMSSVDRHLRESTIDKMLHSLRYTKHLALIDNKMNPSEILWQKSLWTMGFETCDNEIFFYIGSDTNLNGTIEVSEAASSSVDNKLFFSDKNNCSSDLSSEDIFIEKNLLVSSVVFDGCGSNTNSISFDYLGRPHTNINNIELSDYNTLIENDCIITLKFNADLKPIIINIKKETGFISINKREGL